MSKLKYSENYLRMTYSLLLVTPKVLEDHIDRHRGGLICALTNFKEPYKDKLDPEQSRQIKELIALSDNNLHRYYYLLRDNTVLDKSVLDILISKLVLTKEDREQVSKQARKSDRNKTILDILIRRPKDPWNDFLEALKNSKENDEQIVSKLEQTVKDSQEPHTCILIDIGEYTTKVQKNYDKLVNEIDSTALDAILDKLIAEEFLSGDDREEIVSSVCTTSDKIRKLLDKIHSESASIAFLNILREDEVYNSLIETINATHITAEEIQSIRQACQYLQYESKLDVRTLITVLSVIFETEIPVEKPLRQDVSFGADLYRLKSYIEYIINKDNIDDDMMAKVFPEITEILVRISGPEIENRLKIDLIDLIAFEQKLNDALKKLKGGCHEYITKDLEDCEAVEGNDVKLELWTREGGVCVEWFNSNKRIEIDSSKFIVETLGKIHSLVIKNADPTDRGMFTAKLKGLERKARLNIKEYFTKHTRGVECIEGETAGITCEVIQDSFPARWSKHGIYLKHDGKFEIQQDGRILRLTINKCDLNDAGDYTVNINNTVRTTSLIVKEIPAAILELSGREKELYLDIIKTGTETRFYIRIIIIGENRVGKTCLLRRLLGKEIHDVESTDGVDIVHGCKIRFSNGHWIFDRVSDKRKAILSRIKRAINSKTETSENASVERDSSIQDNLCSQTKQTETSENSRIEYNTRNKPRKHAVRRQSIMNIEENKDNAIEDIRPNSDNDRKEVIEVAIQFKENQIEKKIENILTETVLNDVSYFLDDIEQIDIPEEVLVDCGLWDFAGERDYYATHPIFLNPNAVYLLVANITKDIEQIKTEDGYDKIGEYVDYWFDSVHSCRDIENKMENSGDHLHPPVIVVCTGIDNCKNDLKERKKKFVDGINLLLANEEKKKHLRRICWVSNTEPSDTDFDHLRQSIFEFGKEMKTFKEILPLRWIRLERSLDILRDSGMNILSWPDMINLSSKCSIREENEIKLFLKFQHKVGSIIYFESVEENIILNQKWLADALRCLVSDKFDSDIILTPAWKMLKETGKLEPALIEKLFLKDPQFEFNKHQRHLLKIMELFGIIVKPATISEDGQKQSSSNYYIPCLVSNQTSIEKINKMFSVKQENCKRTPWLCMEFVFMPLDFFNHILCYYISRYVICTEPSTKRVAIYHGMGVFYLDNTKFRKFVLCFSKNTIAIQLWIWKKIEQSKYTAMIKELESVILKAKNKYEPRKVSYILKLKCSDGNIHNPDGRQSYKQLLELEDDDYFCEDHNCSHNINDFFETWFYYRSVNMECAEGCTGLEESWLILCPEARHLYRLGSMITYEFCRQLWIYLGLEKRKWNDLEMLFSRRNTEDLKFYALWHWSESSVFPTFSLLRDTLQKMDMDTCLLCRVVRDTKLTDIPDDMKAWIPSDEILEEFSHHIGLETFHLGLELGLTVTELENINHNHKDLIEQAREILKTWKKDLCHHDRPAIQLAKSLTRVGKFRLAKYLIECFEGKN